ncbi:MAG: anti-sigma factor antagonist [Parachlamydiales bacterium]|jgi:sigma-B regulation protein RsbU (phosphoserine phosphatase)
MKQEPSQINLLVVESNSSECMQLQSLLAAQGYHVYTATTATEAIDHLLQTPFALILCDEKLPDLTGLEVMQTAQTISSETIRIMLTEKLNSEVSLEAMKSGRVFQYISKPWEDEDLSKKVKYAVERYKILKENIALQELIMAQHKALAKMHDIFKSEISLGGKIQESMMVGDPPTNIPGCKIAAATIPSRDIAGDFYEFYHPIPEICDFVLGDVMGKGLSAVLVGTAVKTHLVRFALPYFQSKKYNRLNLWQDDLLSPTEILTFLHHELTSQLNYLDFFVSLFYGRFNFAKRMFTYIDCGSQKAIHYDAKSHSARELKCNNTPLGISNEPEYKEYQCKFDKGDIFVFFSDGVHEAHSPANEIYGLQPIRNLVIRDAKETPETILNNLKQSLWGFVSKEHLEDDLSIIVIKLEDIPTEAFAKIQRATFSSHLSQITPLREFICNLCKQTPDANPLFSESLQLAATEIFANVIKHAYDGQTKSSIVVTGEWTPTGLSIEFADQGKPFDPSAVPHPEMTVETEGGFGWYIIKSIADEISYHPKKSATGWNHLNIFKRYGILEDQMELRHQKEGETLIITPGCTSLDAREAKDFKQHTLDLINLEGVSKVVLDLGNIQYIDSSGLGSLLSVLKFLHVKGGELKLANLKKPVRTIFELVAMHKIFEIFNTAEEATNSYR